MSIRKNQLEANKLQKRLRRNVGQSDRRLQYD